MQELAWEIYVFRWESAAKGDRGEEEEEILYPFPMLFYLQKHMLITPSSAYSVSTVAQLSKLSTHPSNLDSCSFFV